MCQISHFVGLSGVGGVQRNFVEYMNYQDSSNCKLIHKVYTLGKVDSQYKLPISVHDIRNPVNLISLIIDIVSKHKIVHMYNNLVSLKLAFMLLILPACKIILHERGTVWNISSSRKVLLQFVAWKSHLILTNSNATKTLLRRKFNISKNKISVLYNGVNTEIKCRKKIIERDYLSVFRVGFIGRLDTPKGVHVLIDAIRILSDNNIDLFIAGDGVLRSALKDQSKDLKNVHFVGRVDTPYDFLGSIDLLVVPSIREPFGNVCIEAGLCKTPVLAANIDGIPEIIDNKVSGELIIPTQDVSIKFPKDAIPLPEYVVNPLTQRLSRPKQIDSEILAKKILELSKSQTLLDQYKRELYKKVINCFSVENYSKKLYNIYCDIYN